MVSRARSLKESGMTVWLAGGAAARTDESVAAGAALNLWDADPTLVADRVRESGGLEVTWGGPPPTSRGALRRNVGDLTRAGATWAIFGWPVDVDALVQAARDAGPG
jgi:hypothetical protein